MAPPDQKKRGGEDPDPEILRLAELTAGILAEIFSTPQSPITKQALLERPRPNGQLRNVRDLMIGVLHHHFCFNAKTGEICRVSPATAAKNWAPISQQRIAAALGRDRGVISDAAHGVEDAISGDVSIGIAVSEVTETIANIVAQADAWREALRLEALERAIQNRASEHAHERAVLDRVGQAISAEDLAKAAAPKIRCHHCYGKGQVRIHARLSDPAYRPLWEAAEAKQKSENGFHWLTCRFCNGAGHRAASPAASVGAAILAASGE